jgi:hypothetical protein
MLWKAAFIAPSVGSESFVASWTDNTQDEKHDQQ